MLHARVVTGVDAAVLATGLVRVAVAVDETLGPLAVHLGVAAVVGRADAPGRVVLGDADRVHGAVLQQARVDALVLVADLVRAAVRIGDTFH